MSLHIITISGRRTRTTPDGYYNVCELNEEVFQPLGAELNLHAPTGRLQLSTKKHDLVLNSGLAKRLGFSRDKFRTGSKVALDNGLIRASKTYIADEPHRLAVHREVYVHFAELSTSENLTNGRPSTLLDPSPSESEKVRGWSDGDIPYLAIQKAGIRC